MPKSIEPRSWEDLRETGLLWLINRVVFHPRGWAFALIRRDNEIVGWALQGDGAEVWRFDGAEDELFSKACAELMPRLIRENDDARG